MVPRASVKALARPLYYARTHRWPDSNAVRRTSNQRWSSIPAGDVVEAPAGMDGAILPVKRHPRAEPGYTMSKCPAGLRRHE